MYLVLFCWSDASFSVPSNSGMIDLTQITAAVDINYRVAQKKRPEHSQALCTELLTDF